MRNEEKNGRGNGFIKLSRSLSNWEWADDPSMLAVWVHCLLSANWKDYRYHGETIPRGSFLTSYKEFSERCGLSVSTIRRCFEKLEKTGEIDKQVTHHGTLIKVRKYAVFQGSENMSPQAGEHLPEQTGEQTGEQQEKNIRKKEIKNRDRESIKSSIRTETEPANVPPSHSQIISFCSSEGLTIDPEKFFSYYTRKNWQGVTDWKARARAWDKRERKKTAEELPAYYNADAIRDPNPVPATPEEVELVRKQLQRGKP